MLLLSKWNLSEITLEWIPKGPIKASKEFESFLGGRNHGNERRENGSSLEKVVY
jgi:hypothetical protein